MADHHEVVFESEICKYLADHGWLYSEDDTGYDRERALFPEDLFAWLEETQEPAYEKALRAAGSKAKVLDVLTTALDKPLEHGGGTLNILRNGVQYIGGGRLKMAQFRPETNLNATTNEQYAAMRVRVMRQVHFSTADRRSIDMVFFVNGLPVATVELKTDFTQSLDEAINQYRKNRHPLTNGRPEPLLSFGHRALVHFAVSNDLAAMTTRLEGEMTHFLPFDVGHDGGAGNPPAIGGRSATAYLWERVWEKNAWLTIIGRLMIVETKEEWDVATGTSVRRTSMLFPRFHQWEAVTSIVAAERFEIVKWYYLSGMCDILEPHRWAGSPLRGLASRALTAAWLRARAASPGRCRAHRRRPGPDPARRPRRDDLRVPLRASVASGCGVPAGAVGVTGPVELGYVALLSSAADVVGAGGASRGARERPEPYGHAGCLPTPPRRRYRPGSGEFDRPSGWWWALVGTARVVASPATPVSWHDPASIKLAGRAAIGRSGGRSGARVVGTYGAGRRARRRRAAGRRHRRRGRTPAADGPG